MMAGFFLLTMGILFTTQQESVKEKIGHTSGMKVEDDVDSQRVS